MPHAADEAELPVASRHAGPAPLVVRDPAMPKSQGMYDPSQEHDACGVGFVADMHDRRTHAIVQQGLKILENLDHRGAVGADPKMGDGCGILTQIPHDFFAQECSRLGFELPPAGRYAIGQFFMPKNDQARAVIEDIVQKVLVEEGLPLVGWRDVPVEPEDLGQAVKDTEPHHRQLFIGCPAAITDQDAFERRIYIARKAISGRVYGLDDARVHEFYPVSVSTRTIVYKGMVLVHQLGEYFLDLKDERFVSALALVHQRFATNTFPTWRLSHPYRMVAHNGEINTLRGNVNWMKARQASVDSDLFGNDISKIWPISYEGQSDTACFDNALEFLVMGGYSLSHAMMMLIPEAWAGNPLMTEERRAFYEYHAALMEPWDGPAAVAFTDGRQIGATLDRNGLRPARYLVTDDGLVVLASEMGVLPIPDEKIVQSWRLQPGRMLLIDLEKGRIVSDEELKEELAAAHPYAEWVKNTQIVLEDLHPIQPRASRSDVTLLDRQQAFGYTQEDLKL
ncbi:MAG: glutamate synthase subunit alpha, partial [Methylobacterium sp.]